MTERNTADTDESIVRKDLDDCDRTDGFTVEHYSREDVAAACHANGGQSHE